MREAAWPQPENMLERKENKLGGLASLASSADSIFERVMPVTMLVCSRDTSALTVVNRKTSIAETLHRVGFGGESTEVPEPDNVIFLKQ